MRLIHTVAGIRQALTDERGAVLVPTMGNLHAGHISLVNKARSVGKPVVASIFVNPIQFGKGEDFQRYPRTLDEDCAKLEAAGCDFVFAPDVEAIYPEPQTFLVMPPLADELCGAFRPGHFQGVCTVVLKLFGIIRPSHAIFGKKDYQQLFLLRGMVRQFNLGIDILEAETTRSDDGLALSSRNAYLTEEERAEAPRLHAELSRIAAAIRANAAADLQANESEAVNRLKQHCWMVDYVSIRSRRTLLPPSENDRELVVLGAARLGMTRLIDNIEI